LRLRMQVAATPVEPSAQVLEFPHAARGGRDE